MGEYFDDDRSEKDDDQVDKFPEDDLF